jgi:hypothetical protein
MEGGEGEAGGRRGRREATCKQPSTLRDASPSPTGSGIGMLSMDRVRYPVVLSEAALKRRSRYLQRCSRAGAWMRHSDGGSIVQRTRRGC